MTTTVDQTIDATLRYLLSGQPEQRNRLANQISASDTNAEFEFDLKGIQEGTNLAAGLEMMYVWQVNDAAKSATVERGMGGSTAAIHTAASHVIANPAYSRWTIFNEINDCLTSLSSPSNGLFQIKSQEIVADSSLSAYALTADVQSVIDVRMQQYGNSDDWVKLHSWEVLSQAETDDFATGKALLINDGVNHGLQLRVRYKAAFGAITDGSTTLESTGLPSTAADILPLAIAGTLLIAREGQRTSTQAQPDSRRAGEVREGASAQAGRQMLAQAQARISEEASRLNALFPMYRR